MEPNSVDKIVGGKRCGGITAVLELPHVVADAGKALEPAVAVQKILHLGGRHALCSHEIQNDAAIHPARPRFPGNRGPPDRSRPHSLYTYCRRPDAPRGAGFSV